MNTLVKIGLGAAAVGLGILLVKGRQIVDRFTFDITGVGLPKFSGTVIDLPLYARFNNPLPTSIPVDRLEIDIFMLQGNTWQHVGRIDQPLTIDAGVSTKTITPRVDVGNFFKSNFLDTLQSVFSSKKVNLTVRVKPTVQGVTLPEQTQLVEVEVPALGGLGYAASESRPVKPMPAWAKALVPKPKGTNQTVLEGSEDIETDTVPLMIRKVKRTLYHTRKLADRLSGSTLKETLRNNWQFVFDHIRYKKDTPGREEIRSPRRLVHEGVGDCDCFTVFLSSLLLNQEIPHYMRIMKEAGNGNWSHVYIVVPNNGRLTKHGVNARSEYTVLDAVTNSFDFEPNFSRKKDFPVWP